MVQKSLSQINEICSIVDPPGLEPGLCGTKIRRVANYTMGQLNLKGAAKLEKKFNS
jgi:hypothetical protein